MEFQHFSIPYFPKDFLSNFQFSSWEGILLWNFMVITLSDI